MAVTELSPLRRLARDYYLGVLNQADYRRARAGLLDDIAGETQGDDEPPTRPQDRRHTEDADHHRVGDKPRAGLGLIVIVVALAGAIAAWWVMAG